MEAIEKVLKVYPNAKAESQKQFAGSGEERAAHRVRVKVPGGFRTTNWHWEVEHAWDEAAEWEGVK
jgi:head-tail adaptor